MVRILLISLCLLLIAPASSFAGGGYPGARLCALSGWGGILHPGPQSVKKVKTYKVAGKTIYGYKFGRLKGMAGKVYVFAEIQNGCFIRVVSMGSYETTNAMIREMENRGKNWRLYHLDLYIPGKHGTLGFLKKRISYSEAWKIARGVFAR